MNWWIWRIVSDQRIPAGLHEVSYQWSFGDLLEAHRMLDALDEIAVQNHVEMKRQMEAARNKRG